MVPRGRSGYQTLDGAAADPDGQRRPPHEVRGLRCVSTRTPCPRPRAHRPRRRLGGDDPGRGRRQPPGRLVRPHARARARGRRGDPGHPGPPPLLRASRRAPGRCGRPGDRDRPVRPDCGAERREDGFDHVPHRAAADEAARPTCAPGRRCCEEKGARDRDDGVLLRRARLADAGVPGGRRRRDRVLRAADAAGRLGHASLDEARQGLAACRGPRALRGRGPRDPEDDVRTYERALEEAGIDRSFIVYPDAPHSFFDRAMTEYADACRDAWARVLGFVDSLAR